MTESEEETATSYLKNIFVLKFGHGGLSSRIERPADNPARSYGSKFSHVTKRQRLGAQPCGNLEAEFATWRNLQLDGLSQVNPFEFWNINSALFPQLAVLATNILSIPMNIAPLERTFSVSTLACSGRRTNLDGSHLAREVFASRNQYLTDFAAANLQ